MSARRLIMTAVGLVMSAIGLVVAFAHVHFHPWSIEARVHWPALKSAFTSARGVGLVAYAVLNLSTLVWRALQLQALARRRDGGQPELGPSWRAVTVSMLAQTILPARLGEAARVVVIVREGDVATPEAVGAIALGRVLDLVALLSVTCAPPLLLGLAAVAAGPLRVAVRVGSWAALLLLGGLIYFYRRRQAAARAAHGLRPWLGRLVGGLAEGLSAMGSRDRLLRCALTSLAIPATVAAAYASAAYAFDITLPAGGSLVMVAIVFLAIAVPSAPSAVGVYHAVAGWVLAMFGATPVAAAAFALSTHAIGVVEFVIFGGLSFARMGRRTRGEIPRA